MNWRDIWYEPHTQHLRSGWRAVVFLAGVLVLGQLLQVIISEPLLFAGMKLAKMPLWLAVINGVATAIACYGVGHWAARTFEALTPETLGVSLRGTWLQRLLGGLLTGFLLIVLVLVVLQAVGLARITWQVPTLPQMQALLGLALAMLVMAAGYEMLIHGYLFQTLLRGLGMPLALLASALFTVLMSGVKLEQPIGLANIFVWAILFAMLYLRSGSLWLPIGVSAGWNFGILFFHLPMSGMQIATPCQAILYGSALLTGGANGPESGALISAVMLALLAGITYSRHGLPLLSDWWHWRELTAVGAPAPPWDFAIGSRYYQWRLPHPEEAE